MAGESPTALTDDGMLYVEVHTTEDPGSDQWPGSESNCAGQRNRIGGDQLLSTEPTAGLGLSIPLRSFASCVMKNVWMG